LPGDRCGNQDPAIPDLIMQHATYPDLRGKRVVITGGGSGIGAAIVEAFAKQGAQAIFLDIDESSSRAVERDLGNLSPAPRFVKCDLRDLAAVRECFARIARDAGDVEILVNNAANDDRHAVEEVTPEYWDERIAVNLRHQFFCAQAVIPAMKKAGGGAIVNLGSISWHLALPDMPLYQTAKAAIEGMTRALARDLGGDRIRVNCIVPGAVRTPRQTELWHTPEVEAEIVARQCLKARVEPDDIAAMALFLASDSARMCTAHSYFVDAGYR
jgi:NAD(P)-dependent dehydrogenase (short-subunit alcohol dehydrogenase family)